MAWPFCRCKPLHHNLVQIGTSVAKVLTIKALALKYYNRYAVIIQFIKFTFPPQKDENQRKLKTSPTPAAYKNLRDW